MAFVKDVFLAESSATSVTVDYAAVTDDFMLLLHSRKYGAAPSTPSGWTPLSYTAVSSGGFNNTIWYRKAGASEPTSVTITGAGSQINAQLVVCEGVDTTTPFDVTVTSRSSSSASTASSAAITPTTANCLILYLVMRNNTNMAPVPGLLKIARNQTYSYYTYGAGASVTVPAHDFYSELNANINPAIVTVALRDDGGDVRKGFVDVANPPADVLHFLGTDGQTGHLTGTAPLDLTATITSLQGVTTTYRGGSGSAVFDEGFQSAGITTSYLRADCYLNGSSTSSSHDIETDIISFTGSGDVGLYRPYDTLAKHFVLGDGTNFRAWKVDALNTVPTDLESTLPHVIEVDGGFESEEIGTVTATTLQTIDNYAYSTPGTSGYDSNNFGFLYRLNTMIIVGGSASKPADMNTAVECARTTSLRTVASQSRQSQSQFFCAQKIQVGDGTVKTIWNSNQHSHEWPAAYSEADRRVQIQINAATLGFYIKASSSCDIDFSTTTFNMGDQHVWELLSGTSTSATYSESGAIIIGGTPILRDIGRAIAGMTFTGCKQITQNTADLTGGNTIDGCVDTYSIVVTTEAEFNDIHNCDWTNNNYSIRITGNHGGDTWSATGMTVAGGTGSYDIRYEGTGTLTIEVDTGSGWTQPRAEATVGTLTLTSPALTLSINSDTASTLIRYFEDDSQTIVDSTTGTSLDYIYTDTDLIDIELVKQSYVPVNRQDITPYDGDYDVIMDFDEAYNSGHGLTNGVEYDYNRATKVVTINSDQAAIDVRSALADDIRTNSSYNNTPLLAVAIPGLTRIDLTDGMTITSMATWKGAGMEMFDAADSSNPLEKWFALKSGGFITGATTHYRQTDSGNSTAVTLTNDVVDEAFQYWDDPNHDGSTADGYDYSDYMVVKAFLAGYRQARSDVLNDAGVSALASNSYQIVLANATHGYSGSDPGISADLTLIAGGVEGGETFAYEWVDGGVNTGADIADQINYNAANNPNAIIPGGTGLRYFELPDMVIHTASAVETERGYEEGTTPTLVGFYCSRGGADHPGFTRFQADNGNYYTPAVTSNISITTMPVAGNRILLQIHNDTAKSASGWDTLTPSVSTVAAGDKILRSTGLGTEFTAGLYYVCTSPGTIGASEPTFPTVIGNTVVDGTVTWTCYAILFTDADPAGAGFADSYTDGEEFDTGDTYRVRFAELDTTTSFKIFETTGIVSSTGFSVVVNEEADVVYAINAVDGSSATVTNKFSPDYGNNEIDLDTNTDFAVTEAFAYYCYELTTSEGMYTAWGGVTAIDSGNYRNNVSVFSLYFDETAGFVKQTDSARWFRSDDTRPARDPTTGGNGIEINWRNPVYAYDGGGGGFNSGDRATLDAAATQSSVNSLNDFDPATDVVEGSETYEEAMRLVRAEAAGKLLVTGTTVTIRDAADAKDRITATVDANGQRTSVTTDSS